MQKIEVEFEVEFDAEKRLLTLVHRGVDMARADEFFAGPHLTYQDVRVEYGEDRWITIGLLEERMVFLAWTKRGTRIRIIDMRKANVREQKRHGPRLGRPGRDS